MLNNSLNKKSLPQVETYHDTDFYAEVIQGLSERPRNIPPKFFYDETGSRLFDAICNTQEYYPTRTEKALLKNHLTEIAQYITPGCALIEPGCGSCEKVSPLLEHAKPHTYVPMDISGEYLQGVSERLTLDHPNIHIKPACIDYTAPLTLPFDTEGLRRVAFFPGSSIGNFEPDAAASFMSNIANMVGSEGGLLIGVDLKKDTRILDQAYNDADGVTAEFNKNLLTRINNELNGQVNTDSFFHRAHYNADKGRVEMHLVSTTNQIVKIDNKTFHFKEGESIHTENSYKYTVDEFHSLASKAGFSAQQYWTDDEQLFSIHYLTQA